MTSLAQEAAQKAITVTKEKTIVKNTLRFTLGEISYLRGIFPEDSFKVRPFGKQRIHVLKSPEDGQQDKDAIIFNQWMAEGVNKAIDLEVSARTRSARKNDVCVCAD